MSTSTTPAGTGRSRFLFVALACYLIAALVYRVIIPAHELPLRHVQVLTIALDILALGGLIGLRAYGAKALFWCGVAAGIGLLLIRVTGSEAWWSGHLMYQLAPRR